MGVRVAISMHNAQHKHTLFGRVRGGGGNTHTHTHTARLEKSVTALHIDKSVRVNFCIQLRIFKEKKHFYKPSSSNEHLLKREARHAGSLKCHSVN